MLVVQRLSDQGVSCYSFYLGLNLRGGVHFMENVAKNTDYIKKWFKQKLFRIKFTTKNSVDAYLYLPQEWSWGGTKIAIFEIL